MKDEENVDDPTDGKLLNEGMKTQYDKLANDWRHFNTILWGVPSVAIALMTGIILGSYRPELEGWPRIVSLSVGSFLLFALAIEVVKKRYHMNVISLILRDIQEEMIREKKFQFPLGLKEKADDKDDDIKKYIHKFENLLPDYKDPLFTLLNRFYARKTLTWVVFVGGIAVGGLAIYEIAKAILID